MGEKWEFDKEITGTIVHGLAKSIVDKMNTIKRDIREIVGEDGNDKNKKKELNKHWEELNKKKGILVEILVTEGVF